MSYKKHKSILEKVTKMAAELPKIQEKEKVVKKDTAPLKEFFKTSKKSPYSPSFKGSQPHGNNF